MVRRILMIWAFVVAAVAILYLALRFRRFQSWVEPALTIVVAFGLAVAILIWFVEEKVEVVTPAATITENPVFAADTLELSSMEFVAGQPATSYRVTGELTNKSDVPLQSFRLSIVLSDCPSGTCREVGSDSALIILRVLPGETKSFTTFAVFPGSEVRPATAPEWSWTVSDPRAYGR
jgi:hypothetical protein